jgi:hypothetical protein
VSRYLVDTNILSTTAPSRSPREELLAGWLRSNSERIFISTIGVAEQVEGIAHLRRLGSVHKALALEAWLGLVLRRYRRRTLSFDVPAARDTGRLLDHAHAPGRSPGFADLAIAGIAMANGMTLLTRNLRHFAPLGVPAHDPYASLPT